MTEPQIRTSQVPRIPPTPWQQTDEGNTIKVRVSFTDDAGNAEGLTSAATDAVEARPNSPATGAALPLAGRCGWGRH